MNPVISAIETRRSIRSYDSRPIPRDILTTVINAANEAPSAINCQPWRFVVAEDPAVRQKLLSVALPQAEQLLATVKQADPARFEMIKSRWAELPDPIYYSAPVIVFVIGSGGFAGQSCPLACANLMLAAHSLGLGSCWVAFGSYVGHDPEIKGLLELAEGEVIFGPIILGYPKVEVARPPKKEPRIKWV